MNLEQYGSCIKACVRPHDHLNGDKIGQPNYVCSKIRTLLIFFSIFFFSIFIIKLPLMVV